MKLMMSSICTINVGTLGTTSCLKSQSCNHGADELHGYMFMNNPDQALSICWVLNTC